MAQFVRVSDSKSEFAGIAFGNAFAAALFGFLQKTQNPIRVETNATRSASGIYNHSSYKKTAGLNKNDANEIFELGDSIILDLKKMVEKLTGIKEDYKCFYDHITYHGDQFSKILRLLLNEIRASNEVVKNPKKEREKQLRRCQKYVRNLPGFSYESKDFVDVEMEVQKQSKRQKTDDENDKKKVFVLIRSGVVVDLSRTPRLVQLSDFWTTILVKNKLVVLTKIYNMKSNSNRDMVVVIRSLLDVDGILCEDAKILTFSLLQKVFATQGLNPHLIFSGTFSKSLILKKIHSLVIEELRALIPVIDDYKERLKFFVGLCSRKNILVPDELTYIEYPTCLASAQPRPSLSVYTG